MITFFAAPKAFAGAAARSQRNAIGSWLASVPDAEVIVLGDEPGTSEACRELGVRQIPVVATNAHGTPLVSALFETAQSVARYDVLCYVNSDIILLDDFGPAARALVREDSPFLMVGQRCTVDVIQLLDFASDAWAADIRLLADTEGVLDNPYYIDYFVFSRGLFADLPPFAIGRPSYDNWLIWRALRSGAIVADATEAVLAVHQRHDYSHVAGGRARVYEGEEARRNLELAGGQRSLRSIADATHVVCPDGRVIEARGGKYEESRRARRRSRIREHPLVRGSRPLRHTLGIRRSSLEALKRLFTRR